MVDCSKIPYKDKMCHFIISAVLALMVLGGFHYVEHKIDMTIPTINQIIITFMVVLVIGLAKEASDDKFDYDDVLADVYGIVAGMALVFFIKGISYG